MSENVETAIFDILKRIQADLAEFKAETRVGFARVDERFARVDEQMRLARRNSAGCS